MRSIGLWPWFKDQGLIPVEMPFAVCNLPRVMRVLQSDISAKRTPLPTFRLKINAQYLEQKCIALIIEACGDPRPAYQGCQQCFALGLECITADGLGPAAEDAANHTCARCLFNEKSWMGPGKTCSLRNQDSAATLAPQPSQTPESSTSQKSYVEPARQHQSQPGTGSGSACASSTAVLTATPTTKKTLHPGAVTSKHLSVAIPNNRQAPDLHRINTQGLVAEHGAKSVQTGQSRAHVYLENQKHLDQSVSHAHTGGASLEDPNRQGGQQESAYNVTQQTLSQTRQYTWQPPTPVAQHETSYLNDAAQPALKRKRGRPPKDKPVQTRPRMQVWVGNVPIEHYSDEQLAAGISVFTAELNRRRFGTPYPAHFSPSRTIFTPAMPTTIVQVSTAPQDSQIHSEDRLPAIANDASPVVSGSGPGVYQTDPPGPSLMAGAQPQTSQSNSMAASHGKTSMSPSATSHLISPPSSSGSWHSPLSNESTQTSRATAFEKRTAPPQQETTACTTTESGSVAKGSVKAKHETGDMSEATLTGASASSTSPWGQLSHSPFEAAPVRLSGDSAVFIKNEPGTGIPLAEQPASIATAALCLATNMAKAENGDGEGYQRRLSPLLKIERD